MMRWLFSPERTPGWTRVAGLRCAWLRRGSWSGTAPARTLSQKTGRRPSIQSLEANHLTFTKNTWTKEDIKVSLIFSYFVSNRMTKGCLLQISNPCNTLLHFCFDIIIVTPCLNKFGSNPDVRRWRCRNLKQKCATDEKSRKQVRGSHVSSALIVLWSFGVLGR